MSQLMKRPKTRYQVVTEMNKLSTADLEEMRRQYRETRYPEVAAPSELTVAEGREISQKTISPVGVTRKENLTVAEKRELHQKCRSEAVIGMSQFTEVEMEELVKLYEMTSLPGVGVTSEREHTRSDLEEFQKLYEKYGLPAVTTKKKITFIDLQEIYFQLCKKYGFPGVTGEDKFTAAGLEVSQMSESPGVTRRRQATSADPEIEWLYKIEKYNPTSQPSGSTAASTDESIYPNLNFRSSGNLQVTTNSLVEPVQMEFKKEGGSGKSKSNVGESESLAVSPKPPSHCSTTSVRTRRNDKVCCCWL